MKALVVLVTFAFLTITAEASSNAFKILVDLSDGTIYSGRVANGAELGPCHGRLERQSDGSIKVQIAYGTSSNVTVNIPKNASIDAEGASLDYYGKHYERVSIGFQNGKVFQLGVRKVDGTGLTCGSLRK